MFFIAALVICLIISYYVQINSLRLVINSLRQVNTYGGTIYFAVDGTSLQS